MSTNPAPPWNEEDREELVAYLDGELDADAAHRLQTRLQLDPRARSEAESLQQAWDLLDYLPQPAPSSSFTHRTLDRVSAYQSAPRPRLLGGGKWTTRAAWTAALLLAVAVGYGGTTYCAQFYGLWPSDSATHEQRLRDWSVIEQRRDQEWLERQPKAERDYVYGIPPKDRPAVIQQLRQLDRQRREEWTLAQRFWHELMTDQPLPVRLEDFPPEVQTYVTESLLPLLSEEERRHLSAAQGRWPHYPRLLVTLADKHPLPIPGPVGPTRFRDLPPDWMKRFRVLKARAPLLQQQEGTWPDFLAALLQGVPRKTNFAPIDPKYIPSKPSEFAPEIQRFIEHTLIPVLEPTEQELLRNTEGHWPDYPEKVKKLADKHGLKVPGMTLPGDPHMWDRYRLAAGGGVGE
ncbi:MAG: hypothetical protein ACK4RK_09800 [Gemmataceae bacterium]